MTQVTFVLVFFVVVMLLAFSLYHHKKHIEFKMSDIEKSVRSAYPEGVTSVKKGDLSSCCEEVFPLQC